MNVELLTSHKDADTEPRNSTGRTPIYINDWRFSQRLRYIRSLKDFLIEDGSAAQSQKASSIDLAALNNCHYRLVGRAPTLSEWSLVNHKTSELIDSMDDNIRDRFRSRNKIASFYKIPTYFIIISAIATIYYFLYPNFLDPSKNKVIYQLSFLTSLVVWTLAQGGLGAGALVATRIIGARQGDTVQMKSADEPLGALGDPSLLKLRVLIGCLLAVTVGLPFSYVALEEIRNQLYMGKVSYVGFQSLAFVVVPFMLGFSTELILGILNRLTTAIRTLFGIPATK